MSSGPRTYLPSLEGIRGYAFLLVFAVHCTGSSWSLDRRPMWSYPWLLACQLSFVAVPVFFVLSGYLITGILVDTRGRAGYFKVFYLRRAIRILPLYYVALAVVGTAALLCGLSLQRHHALFLVYLQNFWTKSDGYTLSRYINMGHLWSLAVEEQFYVVWPLAIFWLRSRRKLLLLSYGGVAVVNLLRLGYPLLHNQLGFPYQSTFFRSDALLLGAVLALHQRGSADVVARLRWPAKLTLLGGSVAIVCRALCANQALPVDSIGIRLIMPLLSVMGAAVVVLALCPVSRVSRLCSLPWAVHLGKRSYGLYVFHYLFIPVLFGLAAPAVARRTGALAGTALATVTAAALTYATSALAYRFLEEPALRLKRHIRHDTAILQELWDGLRRRAVRVSRSELGVAESEPHAQPMQPAA